MSYVKWSFVSAFFVSFFLLLFEMLLLFIENIYIEPCGFAGHIEYYAIIINKLLTCKVSKPVRNGRTLDRGTRTCIYNFNCTKGCGLLRRTTKQIVVLLPNKFFFDFFLDTVQIEIDIAIEVIWNTPDKFTCFTLLFVCVKWHAHDFFDVITTVIKTTPDFSCDEIGFCYEIIFI